MAPKNKKRRRMAKTGKIAQSGDFSIYNLRISEICCTFALERYNV